MQPAGPHDVNQPYQQPSTGSSGAGSRGRISRIRLGDLLAGAGGLLLFLFSFAPFISYSDEFITDVSRANRNFDSDGSYMAWSGQMFMAPLTWWVIVAGLLLLTLAVWRTLNARDLRLFGFGGAQLMVGLAMFAFAVLIGYALSNKQMFFGLDELVREQPRIFTQNPSFAWGGVLMLISSMVALAGAVLAHLDVGPWVPLAARPGTPGGASAPPQQVGGPDQPQGGYPSPQAYPPPAGHAPGHDGPTVAEPGQPSQ